MDEVLEALRDVVSELQDLNHKLDQMNDGLFYLNLHLDADVTPWTGAHRQARPHPSLTSATTRTPSRGVVKWYNTVKGYGFISQTDGGPDVFVHSAVVPSPGYLQDGQQVVVLEVEDGKHGLIAMRLEID